MYCHIKDIVDEDSLQRGIKNSVKWTDISQDKLNIDKCKVICFYHRRCTLIPVEDH